MIVFGHNNFLIKSYTAKEVGIPEEQATGMLFQVRQRYAHIFWIPIFPIGKAYVLKREGEKQLYEMPTEIKQVIQARYGNPKTPWYSFALLLLGLAIGFFALIGNALDEQRYEDRFYNRYEEAKMLIQYPTTGDCYVFRKYDDPDGYSSEDIILKVKKYDEKRTQFISLYKNLYQDAESGDRYGYHESFDVAEAYNYNPTYIDKNALKNALNGEYLGSKEPVKIEPLEGYYVLEKVDRRELEEL